MGSIGSNLPPASSPSLIVTKATPDELRRIWISTYNNWGRALSVADYVERERYITTIPGSSEGRMTSWVLVEADKSPEERQVLSSCDTWRKPAVAVLPGGKHIEDGIAHVIGGVFTAPEFRGKGYASRMMTEVGKILKTYQADQVSHSHGGKTLRQTSGRGASEINGHGKSPVLFSALYSDIGKGFYAKHGWRPYPSTHISWTPTHIKAAPSTNGDVSRESRHQVRALEETELPELCAIDERLIRARLPAEAARTGRPAVAIIPCLDNVQWHLRREAYVTSHMYADGRVPSIRGAVWGPPGGRLWAYWMRGYYGAVEHNTLNVLRVVVENPDEARVEDLIEGFRGIVELARAEAGRWDMGDVQFWNPEGLVKELVQRCGVDYRVVHREEESIASLMWYGEGGEDREVEWIVNEKIAWC
ncbi:hypothetical protein PpBr36_04843 [Pyricularia pennisetigena]|uniref:hypothetical protein n=1 Tax=Pyricularia pennisetigena TaxID=1578925 RepID=UPI00114DDBE8|nr:hypothetical protein PpBr36_04843 [Pyricularia pennisetigena]TLS26415.1 hypothetical protein PpBr36_04843 [Pyricularia pennisetigena]